MKDEKVWDYSECQIGHPCFNCDIKCTFHLVKDVDKKENKNERTAKESKRTE